MDTPFTKISDEVRELDSPILVVVDDIDRLQTVELLELLKVVRLLGRFPGIDYLLAYDEDTVVDTLSHGRWVTEGANRGRAFMEKIVQYPLSLPPLLRPQVAAMLEEGFLNVLGQERTKRLFADGRIFSPITRTMPQILETPRAVQRYLAQVELQFASHVEGEVDDVDLILATFLRLQFPELFTELENWKSELTRQASYAVSLSAQDQDTDWNPLYSRVNFSRRRVAEEILNVLFPETVGRRLGRHDIGRFAHPDYFDRYLAQTVPDGDIPDSIVIEALERAARGDAFSLRGLLVEEGDNAALAISKVRDRYPELSYYGDSYKEMGSPCTPELFACGMKILDELPDRYDSWTNERAQCTYWLASLLGILFTEDPNRDLTAQIDECENIERRAHVLSTAAQLADIQNNISTRDAIARLLVRETERISGLVLADLRKRDNAPGTLAYTFLFEVVAEFGDGSELQNGIEEGLRSNAFTVEDVAARHVSFLYASGSARSAPWAASFSADLFTALTGIPADQPEFSEKGDWKDRSWTRRKSFARKYIHVD
ncbi:P-loop NTPase fold protein [Brevibacterium linens]|uniref:P-loop NTPase fold protein n=1 Tax=Brevibacterium linens TaxID=1703 RepID=UPI003F8C4687